MYTIEYHFKKILKRYKIVEYNIDSMRLSACLVVNPTTVYRFGIKLYKQVVGIPMDTNCAPLVADLFTFCCERDFMMSLSDDKQADVIDTFNTTSRYLDTILNINNVYFYNMVSQIYPTELQ